MSVLCSRLSVALLSAALVALSVLPAAAQSGPEKGQKSPTPAGEAASESQKRIDEFSEAARVLGNAAGNPECVWLGRRVVNLLWRDDLDTAFRHLDLYDRFGCPGGQVQAAFRCVVRQGDIDPKAPQTLNARIHACWVNPNLPPVPPAAASSPAGGTKQKQ